jgi:nucleoside-diphosphate-sugar epimerase
MRVLVTGSSGLIGVPLCQALRAAGHRVDEFDVRRPPGLPADESFDSRDIRDPDALRRAVKDVDGVVHLAAVARCAPAEADPPLAQAVNVGGTRDVLAALGSAHRSAWFVFASSREVYGEVRHVPVSESSLPHPKAVYGRTKAEAEVEVARWDSAPSRRVAILRFTNLYGSPWDYPDRVIPAFVRRARNGEPLEVRGPDQILDFLEVRDAVRAVGSAVERLGASLRSIEPTNIASGQACSLRSLADQVVAVTSSRSPIREVSPVAWTPSQFVADISRARTALGWEPTIPLRQGLSDLSSAFASLEPRS